MSANDALKVLRDRAAMLKSVSGTAVLTLTRADGESVRLDAAIVMQPPAKLRLRAWKMNQAVFDLTAIGENVWLVAPPDSSHASEIRSAGVSSAELGKMWSMFTSEFFQRA